MDFTRLSQVRLTIQRKVKDTTVLNHLLASGHISEDDAGPIKAQYHLGNHHAATDQLLDILIDSQQPGTVQALTNALEAEEYEYLAKLLQFKEEVRPDEHDRGKQILRLYRPYLCRSITALDILDKIFSERLINENDKETVLAFGTNKGNSVAVEELLDRLMTKKSAKEWYCGFLEILKEAGYKEIVEEIEPAYLDDPEGFVAQYDQMCASPAICMPMPQDDNTMECVDYYESDASVNNLSPPPAKCDGFDLSHPLPKCDNPDYCRTPTVESQPGTSTDEATMSNLVVRNIKQEVADQSMDDVTTKSETDQGRGGEYEEEEEDKCLYSDDDFDENSTLKLRDYQKELAQDALQGRNTIICAPTGSGKTWVALYIVKKHLAHAAAGPRKVVFMARTGTLVKQQSDRFKMLLPGPGTKTKLVTGEDDDSKKVGLFLEDYDIVCLTPQILINNLENRSIADLSLLSMLVLDECHHTKKDEPYNNLMRRYLDEKVTKNHGNLPQIVGLTASIGVGKSNTAQETCEYIVEMCARMDARLVSTVQRNIKQLEEISVNTADEVIKMQQRENDPCRVRLEEAIYDTEQRLDDKAILEHHLTDLMCDIPKDKASQEYQKWTIDIKKKAQHKLEDPEASRDIQSCAMYLYIYNAALEVNSLLETRDVIHFLAKMQKQRSDNLNDLEKELLGNIKDVIKDIREIKCANPNVGMVVQTLRSMLEEKGEDSRAMVFVNQRATCMALAKLLDIAFRNQGVNAGALFGKESRGSEEGMTEADQNERIERFRSGALKILVATSVGTEGIDIPDNNIVLSYNYSGNEITKTQIKGRIRKSGGTNVFMGSESLVERERINAYKISLMHRGLKLFRYLHLKDIESKVSLVQREELRKYRQKKFNDETKRKRKRPVGDLEIQCINCRKKACMLSDVRCIVNQYIVIDPNIKDRVKLKPLRSPKSYDGFQQKSEMICTNCPWNWGHVTERKGAQCYTLKLKSVRFWEQSSSESNMYKTWTDVPYQIKEMSDADWEELYGAFRAEKNAL